MHGTIIYNVAKSLKSAASQTNNYLGAAGNLRLFRDGMGRSSVAIATGPSRTEWRLAAERGCASESSRASALQSGDPRSRHRQGVIYDSQPRVSVSLSNAAKSLSDLAQAADNVTGCSSLSTMDGQSLCCEVVVVILMCYLWIFYHERPFLLVALHDGHCCRSGNNVNAAKNLPRSLV
mmetsp:Transcript_20651/g.39959  ORF Transcript_20651/g.39959 Transcript_20651/m.39959 type:complete len:178 (+) Transcript_20651:103-636(+)